MSSVYGNLLHPEYFRGVFGEGLGDALTDQVASFAMDTRADSGTVPDISFVVQSCRDTPAQMNRLFDDLDAQDYPHDRVQRIVVSAENSDETEQLARERGATVVNVGRQRDDFRPNMLNTGLKTADNDLVFSTIGHAALTSNLLLRTVAFRGAQSDVVAAYGTVLPDNNASLTERLGARLLGADAILRDAPFTAVEPKMGLLAADCSLVKKSHVGLYDPYFGAGGADGKMGAMLMRTRENRESVGDPYLVVCEATLAVHHTHGFGPIDSLRQLLAWRRMAQPRGYKPAEWAWHPNGGL